MQQNKNTFCSLGERIVDTYIKTYPRFKPSKNEAISEESQKQMYDFLFESMNLILHDNTLANITYFPDDCYENGDMSNSRPELIDAMMKTEMEFMEFYGKLYQIGNVSSLYDSRFIINKASMRFNQSTIKKYAVFGLSITDEGNYYTIEHPQYPIMFPAWKLHCDINTDGIIRKKIFANFLQGKCHGKQYSAVEVFGPLLNNPDQLLLMEKYLFEKGYSLENDSLSVSWVRQFPKKKTGFFKISYSWRNRYPLSVEIQIPNFRLLLDDFYSFDDATQHLIFDRLNDCVHCGYCTQMDKTGKRSELTMKLVYKEREERKCPLYPKLIWLNIDQSVRNSIESMFCLAENYM